MCGIAGAIGWVDDSVHTAVRRAAAAQAHRGPDADGFWSADGVALSHRRLSIIDLSRESDQPMIDAATGVALSFNGEIYNYRELRSQLERMGDAFRTNSDTEVLLKAVSRWGAACLERLRGMFAFAAYDPRSRTVLIARDRLGVKPVYLARVGATVLFASELRAMLASGMVQRRIDPAGLASYLWNGFVVGPRTIVRGVTRLDPGCFVEVKIDDPVIAPQRYWRLPAFEEPVRDGVPALAEELRNAVRMRLVSDVPLGVFLSGGIDSSAITAMARRDGDVSTFSVKFDEVGYDESRFAREVARKLDTRHTELHLGESMFIDRLDDALGSLDHPTFDGINTYFVSRAAREAGVTVALAGVGGDEVFGGYRSFMDLPRLIQWRRRLSRLPSGVVRQGAAAASRWKMGVGGDVPPQTRWGKLGDALTCTGELVDLYQLAYAMFLPEFQSELLSDNLAESELRSGLPRTRAGELAQWTENDPPLHAISTMELACFVGERLLPDVDAASMAVSMELRVPLLDHRVVECAARVEVGRRFMPVGRKMLLRELALEGLDPALFNRPKQGFVIPIEKWCRQGMRDQAAEVMLDRDNVAAVGLCPDAVGRLWRAFDSGSPGIYWSRIWSMIVLLKWSRAHGLSVS